MKTLHKKGNKYMFYYSTTTGFKIYNISFFHTHLTCSYYRKKFLQWILVETINSQDMLKLKCIFLNKLHTLSPEQKIPPKESENFKEKETHYNYRYKQQKKSSS